MMTTGRKMAKIDLLETVQRDIRLLMNQYADDIATGSCKDFPEYKRMAGVIEGLALAERAVLDIDEKLTND